ncbi:MAG: hypothetical protein PSX71_07680 [bacterium]|nr:hypothetical protein [bacterium]
MATSFTTQLKNIAITAFELGKAQFREKLSALLTQTKESRAGQLLEAARQRLDSTATAAAVKKPRRAAKQAHA